MRTTMEFVILGRMTGSLAGGSIMPIPKSQKPGKKTLCYNADIILPDGKNEIASVTYPQIGMQSNLDPDYIEYQILLAKTAKIDGFFIEWGFMGHENDILLKAMQRIASKYNFEIGVNWCDGWIYYDWITKRNPEINTREKKTENYVQCYQYLLDSVFSVPTAPLVKGKPVFYLFGPGATPDEYQWIYSRLNEPKEGSMPYVLRRWAEWGSLENDKYIPVETSEEIRQWIKLGTIPTAWLPARVRPMDNKHPYWDFYATEDDVIQFMKPFRDSVWNNPKFPIKSGFVMPGMDNRGCAGWGHSRFFYIPRAGGDTYRKMWEFNLTHSDKLDMIFIASWSDYTEGHEIEPTEENGNRALKTTLKYASFFKNEKKDERGLDLPLRLFKVRKNQKFLSDCGFKIESDSTDEIARLISKGLYKKAKRMLLKTEKSLKKQMSVIKTHSINLQKNDFMITGAKADNSYLTEKGVTITFKNALVNELNQNNHKGYILFDYYDEGYDFIRLTSDTNKDPMDLFKEVASIKKDNTGEWKQAKVELLKENILYQVNEKSLTFSGKGLVRNIKFHYQIFDSK